MSYFSKIKLTKNWEMTQKIGKQALCAKAWVPSLAVHGTLSTMQE